MFLHSFTGLRSAGHTINKNPAHLLRGFLLVAIYNYELFFYAGPEQAKHLRFECYYSISNLFRFDGVPVIGNMVINIGLHLTAQR